MRLALRPFLVAGAAAGLWLVPDESRPPEAELVPPPMQSGVFVADGDGDGPIRVVPAGTRCLRLGRASTSCDLVDINGRRAWVGHSCVHVAR